MKNLSEHLNADNKVNFTSSKSLIPATIRNIIGAVIIAASSTGCSFSAKTSLGLKAPGECDKSGCPIKKSDEITFAEDEDQDEAEEQEDLDDMM